MISYIGKIGNYYGGLVVKEEEGKFYWGIESYCDTKWEEIPHSLYNEIMKFHQNEEDK